MKLKKYFKNSKKNVLSLAVVSTLLLPNVLVGKSLLAEEPPVNKVADNSSPEELGENVINLDSPNIESDTEDNGDELNPEVPPVDDSSVTSATDANNASNNNPSNGNGSTDNTSTTPSTAPSLEPDLPKDKILYVGDIRIRYEKNKIPVFKDQEETELVLTLQNYGRDVAENVVLTPILDNNTEIWPFEIESNDYSVELKELKPISQVKPKETYKDEDDKERPYGQIVIKGLKVREGVRSGYLPIRFNITYFNKKSGIKNEIKDRKFYIKHEVTVVPTEASDNSNQDWGGGGGIPVEEKVNTPRLILLGFETKPEKVQAGTEFTLKLNFQNTSKDTLLQNIKLTLSSEESSFLPKSGSSTLFVEQVEIEEKVSTEIKLLPLATLAQKPYPINISIEFEDKNHNELKSNETISVPVYQIARTEINGLTLSNENTVGSESNIRFNILNKGKSILYNATIKFPEDGPFGAYEEFVGNIDAGKQNEMDIYIPLKRAPELDEDCYFELVFEDELGEISKIKQVFELKNVIDNTIDFNNMSIDPDINGEMGLEDSDNMSGESIYSDENMDIVQDQGLKAKYTNLPTWLKVIIPIATISAIGTITGVAIRRHRRRKDSFDNEI